MIRRTTAALVLVVASGLGASAQTPPAADPDSQTLNLSAYAELLRTDIRAQKVAILTEIMGFTDKESEAFWPIYRAYEQEAATLGDERVALVQRYLRDYATITDASADKMAKQALSLETRRDTLKAKYYEKVAQALSPRTALRFLQVEHQLQLLIDLQIVSSLPVAPVDT